MDRELPPDFDVDYQLTRLVRQVRARSLRNLASIHEELDYSTFVLLLAVVDAGTGEGEGVRASELADSLHVHKSTVSRAVRLLETMQLVDRTPHPEDGRAHVLKATPEATRRVDAYRENSHARLAAALEHWEPTELRTFAQLLGRLNDALGAED
ncbi:MULTISPECIES: MarR family winged helix-turn-helix transcriptional regulator [unclassified Aeromicrobium]|uniref:MarR family winged helix-turn-helix transcriptional regulator n=1 Tax=unclassified Aeromicrobium TaxID=2633570 RepID=UPI00288C0E40|nr:MULTISPECIES: MarR family winged helix-turn-helix transcriptional regulator [unclassified Aeromicrobium]